MKIHFYAGDSEKAQSAYKSMIAAFGQCAEEKCDYVVVLGGDGTMLEALHEYGNSDHPVYGVNFGSVGFLMNPFKPDDLVTKLKAASAVEVYPLVMEAVDVHGKIHKALAFNEVSLIRETRQAASLRISVDGIVRIQDLVCDGILVSTPVGSTAYNLSAHGPILPLSSNMLALTPISAFRPRRWRGALIPANLKIRIDALTVDKRPVSVTADSSEFRDVVSVEIEQSTTISRTLLFNPDHHLEERILKEQFLS